MWKPTERESGIFQNAREAGPDVFIVVTDGLCRYCEEAKPFQSALEDFGAKRGIRTIYLINDNPANEPLAEEYQNAGRSVIRVRTRDLGILIDPTFLRVSWQGIVQAMWVGTTSADSEPLAWATLTQGRKTEPLAWATLTQGRKMGFENATAAELSAAASGTGPVIVGFSRAVLTSFPQAKYFDEMHFSVRAEYELAKTRGVVLDCRTAKSVSACRYFARALVQKGYSGVKTIGMSSRPSSCPGANWFLNNVRRRW